MVSAVQEDERNDNDADDGPETKQLGAQQRGIAISKNHEVISFDIQERKDEITPAILVKKTKPFLETVLVDSDTGVDQVEDHVDP